LIRKAYELGCRLDAWDEYIKWDLWQQAIEELGYDTEPKQWSLDEELPWDSVTMNVSKAYLKREYEKARDHQLTGNCSSECDHRCGVCNKYTEVVKAENEDFAVKKQKRAIPPLTEYVQTVFTYEKTGRAVYNSHIAVMRQFEMAFQRSGLDVLFTQGFNPKPKLEFLNPITMGVHGENELLLCELPVSQLNETTIGKLNGALAEGYEIKAMKVLPVAKSGKKISLASKMKGCLYEISEVSDPQILEILKSRLGAEEIGYNVSEVSDGVFSVRIEGDRNIFKTVFSPEISKFHIAGSCHMVRKQIFMEEL
jgi:hypothetical protein